MRTALGSRGHQILAVFSLIPAHAGTVCCSSTTYNMKNLKINIKHINNNVL